MSMPALFAWLSVMALSAAPTTSAALPQTKLGPAKATSKAASVAVPPPSPAKASFTPPPAAAPSVAAAPPAPPTSSDAAPALSPPAAGADAGAEVVAPAAAAAASDWLAQSEAAAHSGEPVQRWPLVLAMLLMLAAGGAFMALRLRQGQSLWPGGVSGFAIDILATKALGHKHRLVLIETAGERLLLSATERDVRLLSHISSQEGLSIEAQSDPRHVDALTRSMAASQGPMAPNAGLSTRPVSLDAAPMGTAHNVAPNPGASGQQAAAELLHTPIIAPQGQASHESMSAEALYEGAARSMDLDDQDDDLDEPQTAGAPEPGDALASDVAGLARWRQAAAQGGETWGKQV